MTKKLGFLFEDGTPTALYDQLRDKTSTKTILATQIKTLFSELYAINMEIHKATESEIKGAIGRVTGKDEEGVARIYSTFKTLCNIADFEYVPHIEETKAEETKDNISNVALPLQSGSPQFHYNIQIHLPATTDISVYNAIFKSLKDNLLM